MLVLSRRSGQTVVIGRDIEVTVLEVKGDRVKLGFRCPLEVPVLREELHERIGNDPPALAQAECA